MTPGTYVLERKTASGDISPGSFYWARLTLDLQVSTYVLATGKPVLYDVLRKLDLEPYKATPPEKRKYKKKTGELYANQREADETPDEYFDRCCEVIGEGPEKFYQRMTIPRLEHQLVDAALDLQATAEEIERSSFPRNTDACLSYGRPCEYFPVCSGSARIDDDTRYETKESTFVGVDRLLSASSAKTFRACPRKYRFAYVERRRARTEAEELTFGTAVHKALELMDPLAAQLVDPFAEMRKRAMVLGYMTRWESSPLRVVKHEQEFTVPLKDGWVLGGRVDAVCE